MIRTPPAVATHARQTPRRSDRAMDVVQYGIALAAVVVAALLGAVR